MINDSKFVKHRDTIMSVTDRLVRNFFHSFLVKILFHLLYQMKGGREKTSEVIVEIFIRCKCINYIKAFVIFLHFLQKMLVRFCNPFQFNALKRCEEIR